MRSVFVTSDSHVVVAPWSRAHVGSLHSCFRCSLESPSAIMPSTWIVAATGKAAASGAKASQPAKVCGLHCAAACSIARSAFAFFDQAARRASKHANAAARLGTDSRSLRVCSQGGSSSQPSSKPVPMDKAAAARIQSSEAKQSGGGVGKKDSFAARAQSAADRKAAGGSKPTGGKSK